MRPLHYLILIFLLVLMPVAFGSPDAADIARAEQFLPADVIPMLYNVSVSPNWIDGTDSFWYLKTCREGKQFVLVDVENRTRQPAFNHTALAKALAAASGSSVDPSDLPFSEMTIESSTARFSALNKTWNFDLQSNAITEATSGKEAAPGETLSPDGEFALFVEEGNLWVRKTATIDRYPLTIDGSTDYAYAKRSDTVSHPIS